MESRMMEEGQMGREGEEMEDFMQPVARLADELRSEEPKARVEAMKRLSTIAVALGQERTRSELLPFLEASLQDEEDEVLHAMADELGNGFVELVGGKEYVGLLLPVLEGLARGDETVVREAAISSLSKVVDRMNGEQVRQLIIPIVKRMSESEHFPGKASAAHISGIAAPRLLEAPAEQADLRHILASLAHDETTIVRKAVLNNLVRLIRANTQDEAALASDLYPLLVKLSADPHDAVRLLSIEPVAAFGEAVARSSEAMTSMFEPLFQSLLSDRSWRIRYMLAKHFAQLSLVLAHSNSVHPAKAFCALLRDAEPEVRTTAASELVHVAKVLSPEDVRTYLIPALPTLLTDASPHVKAALALSLNDLSPVIGPNSTVEHILPLIIRLLSDDTSEVRLNIVTHFERTVQVIGIDLLYDVLLPAIARLAQDPQWRVRETIISLMPALATLLGHQRYDEKLADMALTWLDDPVFAVRKCAAQCHAQIIKAFGTQWALDSGLVEKLLQLATHSMYLRREISLLIASELLTKVSVDYVTVGYLLPVLEGLKADQVPNVRLAVARMIQTISPVLLADRPDILRDTCLPILQQLTIDTDRDVQFYAQQALDLVPAL